MNVATGSELSVRFVVHGRVQGVGFRDAVYRVAWKLGGLKGHVRNLRDGAVEICVIAEARKVQELKAFIMRGPPLARVDRLEEGPFDPPSPPGPFSVIFRR
jgi:acylphosphatase